jgi:hypothetical protein
MFPCSVFFCFLFRFAQILEEPETRFCALLGRIAVYLLCTRAGLVRKSDTGIGAAHSVTDRRR